MEELSVPSLATVPDGANLTDPVWANATDHPTTVSLSRRVGDEWRDVTAARFRDEVVAVAKGLVAAGVQPGDRVALMSKTRYEWTLVDYAIWAAGGVTVPIYETSSAEQVAWIVTDSGSVAVVVETAAHEKTIASIKDRLPDVRKVWTIEAEGESAAIDALTVAGAGAEVEDAEIERRRKLAGPDDLATIVYTSGTTGRPKGCQLTHRNMYFDAENSAAALRAWFSVGTATLLFLPLAHVYARLIQCGCISSRVRLGHWSEMRTLTEAFKHFQPTFVLAVPRVFEKIYTAAQQLAESGGKGLIFRRAEKVAIAYSRALDEGGPSLKLKIQHATYDRLVYVRLRAALGGRCEGAISGSAPLGERLGHFFRGMGIQIYEGYGLTETSPATSFNTPSDQRIGSVGRPLPGATLRIAKDGEILVKGDHVFGGYWNNPDATAEIIDADGWLHSGDLGELDQDGYLRITGRKKEIIVTGAGKNVAPTVLEDRLRAHPIVSQCIVVGDQKPFIGALITIDSDTLTYWLDKHGKPAGTQVTDLLTDPDLMAAVQEAVDDANSLVSRAESIRKFRILPRDFTEAGGELTPKLSLKRPVILKQYADDIIALYDGQ